jgi:hypothetical protein
LPYWAAVLITAAKQGQALTSRDRTVHVLLWQDTLPGVTAGSVSTASSSAFYAATGANKASHSATTQKRLQTAKLYPPMARIPGSVSTASRILCLGMSICKYINSEFARGTHFKSLEICTRIVYLQNESLLAIQCHGVDICSTMSRPKPGDWCLLGADKTNKAVRDSQGCDTELTKSRLTSAGCGDRPFRRTLAHGWLRSQNANSRRRSLLVGEPRIPDIGRAIGFSGFCDTHIFDPSS